MPWSTQQKNFHLEVGQKKKIPYIYEKPVINAKLDFRTSTWKVHNYIDPLHSGQECEPPAFQFKQILLNVASTHKQ